MRGLTRRGFVQGSAAVAAGVGLRMAGAATTAGESLLVGTGTGENGSKGIYGCVLDPGTGELTAREAVGSAESPTFLAISPDRAVVFAVEEVNKLNGQPGGGLLSFRLDRAGNTLRQVSQVSSAGAGPCHVSTDKTGRCVFVANYGGGSAASYTVDAGGQLSAPVTRLQYEGKGPDAARQGASHAHRVTVSPGNGFLLVNDLGLDKIHVYHLNVATAELTANDPPAWDSPPGAGPRALRFHPNGRMAYCLCELTSTIYVLAWDEAKGTLETVQAMPMLPDKTSTGAAEIVLDAAARFAYASNRGDNFLSAFAVEGRSGKLKFLGRSSCGGKSPRHIALDPSEGWLLVSNQNSDLISVFRRDRKTGRLAETGKDFPVPSPQCCLFV